MAGGPVTNVQQVTITIAANATSGTASITSVNTSLSCIFFNGNTYPVNTNTANTNFVRVALTNATTVTATRNTADASNATTVYATVVTWTAGAIKSMQTGTISIASGTSNTATISSVTTTNAAVIYNGFITAWVAGAGDNFADDNANVQLTNATTVTATIGRNEGTVVVGFTVIEFNSGFLNSSTQQSTCSGTGASLTATITAVTTANTMLFYGGYNDTVNSDGGFSSNAWLTLTNTTTVTATKNASSSGTTTFYFTVVEFKSGACNTMNRGSIAMSSAQTSNTATITSVNQTYTIPNFLAFTCGTNAALDFGDSLAALTMTNATTVKAQRGTISASITDTVGYEIMEFKAPITAAANSFFLVL
jgi:hypothetical protein